MPESSVFHYGETVQQTLDEHIDRAIERMNGDPVAASQLFMRWAEQNSDVRDLLPPLVEDYIKHRIYERTAEGNLEANAKRAKRAKETAKK